MPTAIVSGRVDENVKRIADAHIRRRGLTTTDVIASVWNRIAETGEVPGFAAEGDDRKAAAAARLADLRARAPLGTPLASMTDDEIRRELRDRD